MRSPISSKDSSITIFKIYVLGKCTLQLDSYAAQTNTQGQFEKPPK